MLPNTIQISRYDLDESTDPVKLIYETLMDAGCPISPNGSITGGGRGFNSWTTDGQYLCFSWDGEPDAED